MSCSLDFLFEYAGQISWSLADCHVVNQATKGMSAALFQKHGVRILGDERESAQLCSSLRNRHSRH
jgi:hypothetical protein